MKTKALLLVGHGSSFNRDSSAPIYGHAARIRKQGTFDEVHVAFWKESPWIRDSLARIRSDDVYVVPMFLADGYFTRRVVPRELGLSRSVHLCPPVGAHPCLSGLVLNRAFTVTPLTREQRGQAALIVIGHGTDRSTTSSTIVRRITQQLRERSGFGEVACGFLDQKPRIVDVLAETGAQQVILVPFFMADGWHVRETIPQCLGLTGECTVRGGQVIWYTRAVGTLPDLACAAVDLARNSN